MRLTLTLAGLSALTLGSNALAQVTARVYVTYCQSCHQAGGQGNKGIFPPLKGHAPKLMAAPGGRKYLANLMVGGLNGKIVVDGVTYNGVMPAFPQLNDGDLAGVLNYVMTSFGNKFPAGQKPYTQDEIKAARAGKPNAKTNYASRPKVK